MTWLACREVPGLNPVVKLTWRYPNGYLQSKTNRGEFEVLSMISLGDRLQMKTTMSFNQNEVCPEDEKRMVALSVECKWKKRWITGDVKVWTGMTIFSHWGLRHKQTESCASVLKAGTQGAFTLSNTNPLPPTNHTLSIHFYSFNRSVSCSGESVSYLEQPECSAVLIKVYLWNKQLCKEANRVHTGPLHWIQISILLYRN